MRLSLLLLLAALPLAPARAAEDPALRPWPDNPRYWSYQGKPVLLLGGSDDDNLFQWPAQELTAQLDRLVAAGGNLVRNTLSDRKDKGFEVYPFLQREDGKYDLAQWNPEYWARLERLLEATARRGVFVQIEIWDRFDFTDRSGADRWKKHPYNPANNINYTSEQSRLATAYPDHPMANKHPFFYSTPGQRNLVPLLAVQQRFVDKLLDTTLKHDHVLYCMDNETGGDAAWGAYWAGRVKERAAREGRTVQTTEMWDDWDLAAPRHKNTFDHPELYSFVEVSQNNQNRDEKHWEKILWAREYLAKAPRPMNAIKTYGADGNKYGHSDQDGIERFWRHLLGGAAAVRFHRPDGGLGLSDKAVAAIQAARLLEARVPLWTVRPANELLAGRGNNEAYLAADPGRAYALFFPAGGAEVTLAVPAGSGPWTAHWIQIDTGRAGAVQQGLTGPTLSLRTPDAGNWALALVP